MCKCKCLCVNLDNRRAPERRCVSDSIKVTSGTRGRHIGAILFIHRNYSISPYYFSILIVIFMEALIIKVYNSFLRFLRESVYVK